MATFVLIHGAGSDAWYWHLVAPELEARGHDVVAMDLPSDDDALGFDDYADVVVDAIGDRKDLVVVGQSLGGFTAPLVCARTRVDLLVLVAAMVPKPGERPGDWWTETGHDVAFREQLEHDGQAADAADDDYLYFHDVRDDLVAETMARGDRDQSGTPMERPWPLDAWPDVSTRVLLCRDDRLFPAAFQRQISGERLGITPDEMPGGHLPALAHPRELADRLVAYREDWERTRA